VAKSQVKRSLPADFNLGGAQAEADPLLHQAFYESGQYTTLASKDDPRCFIVGRTGSGKSAMLQRIEEDNPEHVIRINPEDLSLPYISDLGVVRFLAEMDVHLDPFFIALWKHVLLVEIIRHRYKVNSPAAKQNLFTSLRDKISRDGSKAAALEYLNDFDGKFWCETDERVRDITKKFEEQVKKEAGGKITVPRAGELSVSNGAARNFGQETKAQQADRFQKIVNDTQLPRLNKMIGVLNDDILDSPQHYTYVVIDDLDRDWVDEQILNALIRCLFRAVLDLKRVRNLKIIVALRTNIFEQLNFGAKSGGQEEKFRAMKMVMRWSQKDLEELVRIRAVSAASSRGLEGITKLQDLLPTANRTRGNAMDYILRRTLMRPRDVISYFNASYALSAGKPKLSWETIHSAERAYSQDRLLALRDEWKPSYPDIDLVFQLFEAAPTRMEAVDFFYRLDDAALLPADMNFSGDAWMNNLSQSIWNGADADPSIYHPLTKLLYDIGFVGCNRAGRSNSERYFHDDPDYLSRVSVMKEISCYFVHPAFRAGLDIRPDEK
jgi:hypothetical protein